MISEDKIICCGHGSGSPSTKNLASYNASRYAQVASNGVRKGLVCVRRLKALTDAMRQAFHDTYSTIIGRNIYNQNLRQYVYNTYGGKYYSDCSSSICATFKKIGYDVPLLNTAGMYLSDLFEDVPVIIAAGHIMNPGLLKVGDILLYAGNDPSRPQQIGHVEAIYEMPEELPEVPVEGTVTITASELNIRQAPTTSSAIVGTLKNDSVVTVTAKRGEWFKTDKGWISRKFVKGWIKEPEGYWYIKNGAYPMHCAEDIGGSEFHFDKNGWMIMSNRISPSGSVIY